MRAARLWPLGVAAVLAATVAGYALLYRAATGRDAAVVEPDYYRRAVAWDSVMAAERHGAELGWRLEAEVGPLTPQGAVLRARLLDRAGAPLEGATVRVKAIHNLDAAHPVAGGLEPGPDGTYAARLPLRHAGLWELRFEVTRGTERFGTTLRREAVPEGRP